MNTSLQRKLQHLHLRAGFGASCEMIRAGMLNDLAVCVEEIMSDSLQFTGLDFIKYPIDRKNKKGASAFQIIKMILKSKREMEDLNIIWLNKMAGSRAQLREKMTFFWHNHFATSVPFAYLMQNQNNMLRQHALGKFPDLLHAVAKNPAMILYLNNQQNKKEAPNENFAREVMELFTLGIGHYTEKDIKEAARAFTGWTVNRKGEFEFRSEDHDNGPKEFMGRTGNFSGEDILNIILEQKQTAVFITEKIYREFVNENIHSSHVEQLAEQFYRSGYDIAQLMKSIFLADWFYNEENIGIKIISPVEWIVRLKRLINLEFDTDQTLINLQQALGQVLFFPPNVAGWKGGIHWIDSASLLLRLNLPQALSQNGRIKLKGKPAFEDSPDTDFIEEEVTMIADFSQLKNNFMDESGNLKADKITDFLIQSGHSKLDKQHINSAANFIDKITVVMSSPEFQLI